MKVNYLYHSGVSVESDDNLFIFDYYKKGFDPGVLNSYKNVYIFASHAHRDHFDSVILSWADVRADINYIFSYDIPGHEDRCCTVKLRPDERCRINDLDILALDSTDEGVALLVQTPDVSIFHAGDLNWWHWEGEPKEYNQGMADKYRREINKLIGEKIDIAFIPVDPRLDGSMYYSIDYLMEKVDIDKVCPIHFMDDWKYIEKVKQDLANREYYKKINFYEE